MIISLRGPSGSGKSHLTRKIMELYARSEPLITRGRRKPAGYELRNVASGLVRPLFVPGHYEIANGGVDTLPLLAYAYELVRRYDDEKFNVLFEGKNMSDGTKHVYRLHTERRKVVCVFLSTSVEDCVSSVETRGHSIARKSIERVHLKCDRDRITLTDMGVDCQYLSRDAALAQIKSVLGWTV